ncbi:20253_t:CDS:10 [Funneliformis geosporum]|uniref:9801_t:CDS:1 n=1 Tax=Funneliformis geosporum TaxID=1117311 RepID=A0A9W4SQ78_9GLOM|nr:20253_t:CDS:10 [Funneliformis geosporum]CAI2178715.1 9801_t:CDS:10 [Funneliformis geosporum]
MEPNNKNQDILNLNGLDKTNTAKHTKQKYDSSAKDQESQLKEFEKAEEEQNVSDNEIDTQKEAEIPSEDAENALASETQHTAKRGLPAGCLFVASLPSTKSDEVLQKSVWNHFSNWGTLLNVKVLKDWLLRPYSFVQFENICDAKKALVEAHNTVVEGRRIRVEQARVNRTLFIGRLNRTMNEEDIREILEPYGDTEDVHLLRTYSTGKSKGCAFVKFCYRDDAIRAYMNLRQHGSNYIIEWAANLEKAVPGPEDIDKRSIFVGQLNQAEVTKELLVEKFGRYGEIKEVQYVARKFSRSLGPPRNAFAFINYNDEDASENAIKAENNSRYFDRIIRVQYRESQEFRNQQIQLLRQQQEVRRRAFQDSYYNSGRQTIRLPPLSRGQNYYASTQKICKGRKNSIIPEIPVMTTPIFYPQVGMGVHKVVPITSGKQEPKGKGPEVPVLQNNTVSTPTTSSVGMIPAYAGSLQGLPYPYATFMGTINHKNGSSYSQDYSYEPNILHSYAPPYVPGQPISEYGLVEVASQSAQYCGVPIPIQITMPHMYFYPQSMDPGYALTYSERLQTLEEESTSGYEADNEISTHVTDEEKTALGETAEEGSKVFDNALYDDVAQE